MALTLVAEGRIFLPHTEAVSAARIDLARVQPLPAIEASKSWCASTGVSVRDQLANAAVGTRIGIASGLETLGTWNKCNVIKYGPPPCLVINVFSCNFERIGSRL